MTAASIVSTSATGLPWPLKSCHLRHSGVISGRKLAQQIKQEVCGNHQTIVKLALVSEEELWNLINKPNKDNTSGLLVQLRLPEHTDEGEIYKDVDGFHVIQVGRMCLDQYSILPAIPRGEECGCCWKVKNVGMPIAMILHTDGKNTVLADIVVSAAGSPNLITADMIKEGGAVTSVEINRLQDSISASYPGGVGPSIVVMLMKNTIITAKKQTNRKQKTKQKKLC
ncbi:unnamed protein product [Nyctereutes procyonoides]|uniref:(raccoon dog) hypothetical protein n=1 Tax=Nyctereutes procyonoides TaxID=34880 RepID=A0A811Y3Q6_NYCPR|nr:unnamed protein product [Nyctereutes procyonoides]